MDNQLHEINYGGEMIRFYSDQVGQFNGGTCIYDVERNRNVWLDGENRICHIENNVFDSKVWGRALRQYRTRCGEGSPLAVCLLPFYCLMALL